MRRPIHVGLVFDYNLSYPRGVLRGIKQFVQTRPHWVLMHLDTDRMSVRELRTMRPAGMIALVVYDHLAKALKSLRRPVVNVANVLPGLSFPRVSTDHRQVAWLAAAHLRERGFRHFGFVGHPHHVYSVEREAGFREALGSEHLSLARFHERPARSYRHRGRLLALSAELKRWLRELPKPAGVFACNDLWGLPVLEACRLAGLRVPEDVAVVGVDNDELRCELASPSLSSIVVPSERVGYEAAALLERLIEGAASPREPLLIPPVRVVTRQSSDVLAGRDPEVTEAVKYIHDHRHLPTSVDDVLRAVRLSRRSLERRFRAILERSIGEEIRRVHLDQVRELLASTALSIDEVAKQAGFSSVHYLCRVFRKEMRSTPTAYRRKVRALAPLSRP
jgi:LacI family transcriptional regulator